MSKQGSYRAYSQTSSLRFVDIDFAVGAFHLDSERDQLCPAVSKEGVELEKVGLEGSEDCDVLEISFNGELQTLFLVIK